MEGVPFDLSAYLRSEGLSDIMPAGSGLHDDRAGQAGVHQAHREESPDYGSRSGLPVTDLDFSWNYSASRMIQAGDTAECPSTPWHACHNPQLASQYETYESDEPQRHDIAGCVHLDCAEDLAQVAPNDETIASEDQYRSSASTLEPSEAGINALPPQLVPSSTFSQTRTDRDVSKLSPDELKALVPDQTCHCPTCLDGYGGSPLELRWALPFATPAWTARTLSCRVTGCQWTTKDESDRHPINTNFGNLLQHERSSDHYGKRGEWRCREIDCKFVTKRFNDLQRHYTSKHCIKPRDLKCPFLECKYHHVDLSRKDKLKSHVDKVHKGAVYPGKPNQTIKPKAKDHA